MQALLDSIATACRPLTDRGITASYIPELQKADGGLLGLCAATPDGQIYGAGDWRTRFTIQSISKVLIFSCALQDSGMDAVLSKVSLEPTAEAFNSIVNLEIKNESRPLNPMINAGAIVCMSLVAGDSGQNRFARVLDFARQISGRADLNINPAIHRSESQTGSRNRALAYYMQSTGILSGDVEDTLDAYFRACSIEMDCADLARTALVYAMDGRGLMPREVSRTVKAVMTLCGMYNESGRVAAAVGLPCKSGVGGGIMAVAPGKMGISAFGPALNPIGTSVAGLEAVTRLSQARDLSIF